MTPVQFHTILRALAVAEGLLAATAMFGLIGMVLVIGIAVRGRKR